jgi:hypothetical protein
MFWGIRLTLYNSETENEIISTSPAGVGTVVTESKSVGFVVFGVDAVLMMTLYLYSYSLLGVEFNYCFNCGRRIDPSTTYDNEGYCCISFKSSQENGAIEALKHSSKHEFLLNLLPRSQSTEFLNSGCSKVVERAGLNWCPFCGTNLEEDNFKG